MQREQPRHGGKKAGSANMRKPGSSGRRAGRLTALLLAWFGGAASTAVAADLPAPAANSPPIFGTPVYNWTGFYVGGNLGAGWSGLSNTNFSDTLGSSFTGPTNTQFVGGAQVGANYQFGGGVVVGVEAMFDWFTVSHNNPVTATDPTNTVAANIGVADARWLTTATGRIGYAWDRVLVYAKGGGAWVATTTPSTSIAGGGPASFSAFNNTNVDLDGGLRP
jgi:outer membrane immunogenic protein